MLKIAICDDDTGDRERIGGGPPRLRGRASEAQHRDDRLFLRLCDAGRLREGRLSGYRPAGHLYARNAGDGAGAGHSPVQRKYGHSFPDDQLGLRGGRLRAPRRGLHSKAVHAGKTQRLAGPCDRPTAGADMAPAPLRGRAAPASRWRTCCTSRPTASGRIFSLASGRKLTARLTAAQLQDCLAGRRGMIPCGASYVVNLAHVRCFSGTDLIMDGGERIPVPRRLRAQIKQAYFDFYLEEAKNG